jgi:hypothetical protein
MALIPLSLILLCPSSKNSKTVLNGRTFSAKAFAPSKAILLLKRLTNLTDLLFFKLTDIAWAPETPILFLLISITYKK